MSAEGIKELRQRLAHLRLLNRHELLALLSESYEEIEIEDEPAIFTTHIKFSFSLVTTIR